MFLHIPDTILSVDGTGGLENIFLQGSQVGVLILKLRLDSDQSSDEHVALLLVSRAY